MKALLVLVTLGACSNLDPLDAGVCGNGVVETGEDCDSPDQLRCSDCSIVCVDEGTCGAAYDEQGFVCGLDGLCHAGTGELRDPVATIAAIETFAVTRIDDDTVGDVLVQTPTGVQALYGFGDGTLFADAAQLSATPTGPASFADLDGDGRLDVLIPTADGIAAFTSPFGGPTSHAFPAVIGPDLGVPTFGIAADEAFGVFLGDMAGMLVLVVYDGVESGLVPLGQICQAGAEKLDVTTIDVFKVEPRHAVISMGLDRQGGTFEPCVVDVRPNTSGIPGAVPFVQNEIELPDGRLSARPLLVKSAVDEAGPDCPTLIGQASGIAAQPLTYSAGACVRAAMPYPITPPPSSGPLVAAIELENGLPALVFERQIFTYQPITDLGPRQGQFDIDEPSIYTSDRDLVSALSVDLDQDGLFDVIARSTNGTEAVEAIDVLTQFKVSDDRRSFLRLRYDTLGPVSDATIGDYDGDGWFDVAFVQTLTDGQVTADELAIAYGSPTGLLPRSSMGLFEDVLSLIGIGFRDSIDPFGRVSDLSVLYRSCTEYGEGLTCVRSSDQVSQLHGSPQRTLTGYYDPRPPAADYRGPFGAVVLGTFVEADADPDITLDLIAVEHDMQCTDPLSSGDVECAALPQLRLWVNDGALDGDVGQTAPIETESKDDFMYSIPGQYVAYPRGDSQLDLVIGANVFGRGITFDPATTAISEPWDSGVDSEGKAATLRRAELVHVTEGDALVTKLLLVFAGSPDNSLKPSVRVCTLDDPFHPVCAPVEPPELSGVCGDAAVLKRGVPGGRQVSRLIALCRDDRQGLLVEVDSSVTPFALTSLIVPGDDVGGNQLRTGDVTGDSLDDVLVLDRQQGLARIRVYPQCNTRDQECVGRTSP